MTVKEVKERIENLENDYKNMIKMQEYFLGHTEEKEETVNTIKTKLEEGANLNRPIRDLCSDVARILGDEIQRLNNAIDNAIVKTGL